MMLPLPQTVVQTKTTKLLMQCSNATLQSSFVEDYISSFAVSRSSPDATWPASPLQEAKEGKSAANP